MKNDTENGGEFEVDKIELKGFSRSIAEIEWLLLILVLLYYLSPGTSIAKTSGLFYSIVLFALFVFTFHYLNFFTLPTRWKLALETWIMICFISWVIWCTGELDSPLINLYLLVIIASALTLGKLVTFLEFALITALYIWFCYPLYSNQGFSVADLNNIMTVFAPILLVAYVTTMLAADVQYGRRSLKLLSETDDMTGCKNKRAFNAMLAMEFNAALRYSRSFSIMMIDADNLKLINDTYGHTAGDQLIKMLSSTIRQCIRTTDIVARYGGDEFIVLMPETSAVAAKEVAERIRSTLDIGTMDPQLIRITSTVSIGIAGYPDDAAEPESLIDCADRALYASKKAGRNQITVYSTDGGQVI